ncbi:MAG: hypothetical protein C0501_11160 [Isosphaera sp.]|nr:hypothetical protein [Isosphaera sp.]
MTPNPPRRPDPDDREETVMGVPIPAEDDGPRRAAGASSSAGEPGLLPAEAYRPTDRPPTALLTVYDDGAADGEVVRLRAAVVRIGRTAGDVLIPHDDRVASPHVTIRREKTADGWRWTVADAGGTDGLFVRVNRAPLSAGSEFVVGRGRYRFAAGPPPTLTEVVGGVAGVSVRVTGAEAWIGTAPGCEVRRADPFAEPYHARVYHAPGRGWAVEHDGALNGVWLRVPQVTVDKVCYFLIGEQRFRLQPGA